MPGTSGRPRISARSPPAWRHRAWACASGAMTSRNTWQNRHNAERSAADVDQGTFHRPARAYPEVLPTDEIVIEGPPPLQIQAQAGGFLQYLVPVVGRMGSLIFVFSNPSALKNPLIFISLGGVVFLSIAVGLLMRVQQRQG